MTDPLWSNEQIAAWTSTHDVMAITDTETGVYAYAVKESVIRTYQVIAILRQLRDETERRIAALEAELATLREQQP